MNSLLYKFARHAEISWLSFYFAEFITRQSGFPIDSLAGYCAAAVTEANQQGQVCVKLDELAEQTVFRSGHNAALFPIPGDSAAWSEALLQNACIGSANENMPLVIDAGNLYLGKFYYYETRIAASILNKLQNPPKIENSEIAKLVERFFPSANSDEQGQKRAVATAIGYDFCVVSGGPGTGKTSTVIKILAALISQDPSIRIALAAPTGKAAARVTEAIQHRVDEISIDNKTRSAIPTAASTLHRLLDYQHGKFGYHNQNKLPLDCIIVDEASMIDLALMHHLLEALAESARIILLGDRSQLASVSAGNVLGDITGHGCEVSLVRADIARTIAFLTHSYRFDADGEIAELARRINRGEATRSKDWLKSATANIGWFDSDEDVLHPDFLATLVDAFRAVVESTSAQAALTAYEATRVLCATNEGPLGVNQLNQLISSRLLANNDGKGGEPLVGLPILITRNHHDLGLFNGDTGILWPGPDRALQACFRDEGSRLRRIALNRLPEYLPAWATTVHKAQGSEFDRVFLVLAADPTSPVLSRELLYTAVTRARKQFVLQASDSALSASVDKITRRFSGLGVRLGWPDS